MLATVQSGAITGLDAIKINVEIDYNPRAMTGYRLGQKSSLCMEAALTMRQTSNNRSRERVESTPRNR